MRKNFTIRLLLMGLLLCCAPLLPAQVLVIANSGVKVSSISRFELRNLFTGLHTNLPDGMRVTPVLLRDTSTSDVFLASYLNMNETALRATWRSLVFSGQALMPKTFVTEADLVNWVVHTPGAIGYISQSTPHEGVRVLQIL